MSRHNRERREARRASDPNYGKPGAPTVRQEGPSGIVYRTHVSTTNSEEAAKKPALRPARELRVQSGRYLSCDCRTWCS